MFFSKKFPSKSNEENVSFVFMNQFTFYVFNGFVSAGYIKEEVHKDVLLSCAWGLVNTILA